MVHFTSKRSDDDGSSEVKLSEKGADKRAIRSNLIVDSDLSESLLVLEARLVDVSIVYSKGLPPPRNYDKSHNLVW